MFEVPHENITEKGLAPLSVENRYKQYPTLLAHEIKSLPNKANIIIDTFAPELVFGDNILRLGAINLLKRDAKSAIVLTKYPFLHTDTDQTSILQSNATTYAFESNYQGEYKVTTGEEQAEKQFLDKMLANATDDTYLIVPPHYARWRLGLWEEVLKNREQNNQPVPKVVFDVMNCDYGIENITYNRNTNPQLNRVVLAFATQLREKTGLIFEPLELMPQIDIGSRQKQLAKVFLASQGVTEKDLIIAIGDHASRDTKLWDKYPQLLNAILQVYPNIFFVLADLQTHFTSQLVSQLPPDVQKHILYSPRTASTDFLPGLLSQSTFYIGNDSGPGHYFSAINHGKKPILTLFAKRNDPDRWFPCGQSTDYLYSDTKGQIHDRLHYNHAAWQEAYDTLENNGIENITVEDVMKKIKAMIPTG